MDVTVAARATRQWCPTLPVRHLDARSKTCSAATLQMRAKYASLARTRVRLRPDDGEAAGCGGGAACDAAIVQVWVGCGPRANGAGAGAGGRSPPQDPLLPLLLASSCWAAAAAAWGGGIDEACAGHLSKCASFRFSWAGLPRCWEIGDTPGLCRFGQGCTRTRGAGHPRSKVAGGACSSLPARPFGIPPVQATRGGGEISCLPVFTAWA